MFYHIHHDDPASQATDIPDFCNDKSLSHQKNQKFVTWHISLQCLVFQRFFSKLMKEASETILKDNEIESKADETSQQSANWLKKSICIFILKFLHGTILS